MSFRQPCICHIFTILQISIQPKNDDSFSFLMFMLLLQCATQQAKKNTVQCENNISAKETSFSLSTTSRITPVSTRYPRSGSKFCPLRLQGAAATTRFRRQLQQVLLLLLLLLLLEGISATTAGSNSNSNSNSYREEEDQQVLQQIVLPQHQ